MTYETVSRFVQQAGALYFAALFLVAVVYALWPRNRAGFQDAAQIPFREEDDQ
jgi:cytochrome c oxidase cbb3-type subunit 4